MRKKKTISWFSAGVSSALATKLMIKEIDEIIYTHIEDQHSDTMRFVKDCQRWFKKKITIMQSEYKTVENVCLASSYINGVHGAPCTKILKRRIRQEWELNHTQFSLRYVWGFDSAEKKRAKRIKALLLEYDHVFPLIEKQIDKETAHAILKREGIKRPKMYDMGYNNNNCVGCVKGGMGYWNHIRIDFPKIFKARAILERKIGASCIKGIFLDELNSEVGRHTPPIVDECRILCQIAELDE